MQHLHRFPEIGHTGIGEKRVVWMGNEYKTHTKSFGRTLEIPL